MDTTDHPPGLRTPKLLVAWPTLLKLSQEDFIPLDAFEKLYPLKVVPEVILLHLRSKGWEISLAGDVVGEHFPEVCRKKVPLSDLEQTEFVGWLSEHVEVAAEGLLIREEQYFQTKWKKRLFEALFIPISSAVGEHASFTSLLVVIGIPGAPPPY